MSRMCFNCMNMTEDGEFCIFCGKKLKTPPAHHLLPGTVLNNKYTVGYALGEGGFGVTYIGLDNSLQIKVAIKEFFPKGIVGRNSSVAADVSCIDGDESSKLFDTERAKVINEARILAKFSKERGIVNVRDYFEANNTAYIVMEYLEGETLEEYLAHSGPLSADETYTLLYPVMEVLEQLHNEGVVHRDISPDNLMFDGEQIKLLDFGAAREVLYSTSKSFSVILKHGYAPEEQYRRKGRQGPWTDVYALCATMYYCVTKEVPDTSLDRLHEDELRMPSELGVQITPAQETALMRGLSVLPEDRLQSISDFIAVWNGKEVPFANANGDTVWVKNELKDQGNGKTADGPVNGGTPGEVPVTSGNRKDSVDPEISQGEQKQRKSKNKGKGKSKRTVALVSIALVLIALNVGVWLIASRYMGKNEGENLGTSESTSNVPNDTKPPETVSKDKETTKETEAAKETEATEPVDTTDDKRNEYLDKAQSLAEKNDFTEALATIDTAEELYGSTAESKMLRTEIQVQQLLFNVNEYESSGDYPKAIETIEKSNSAIKSNADVIQKLNVLKINYRNKVVSEVDDALKDSNYDKAVELLNAALYVIQNDATLLSKLDECKEYKPVDLAEVKRIDDNEHIVSGWTGHNFSGDPLVNAWLFRVYLTTRTAEFYTARKYSNLSFDIDPCSSFDTAEGNKAVIKVYADGVLVYTSPDITYKTSTVHASININNAENIRIEITGKYSDANSYTILSNAVVIK